MFSHNGFWQYRAHSALRSAGAAPTGHPGASPRAHPRREGQAPSRASRALGFNPARGGRGTPGPLLPQRPGRPLSVLGAAVKQQ